MSEQPQPVARHIGIVGSGYRKANASAIPRELQPLIAPGGTVEFFLPRLYSLPTTQLDLAIQEMGYIEAGLAAAAAGCDAVFLNTFADYGLPALKSALRVPVVGAAEATLRMAGMIGEPFAIVTIWPTALRHLTIKMLRDYRLEDRCCAILHVGEEDEMAAIGPDGGYIAAMQSGDTDIIERILRACRIAVERHGATAIVLGCTCMSPIANRIAARLELPVINPLTTGYKMTELQLSLRLKASRRAYAAASPSRNALVRAMVDTAGPMAADGACDICVVAADAAAAPETVE